MDSVYIFPVIFYALILFTELLHQFSKTQRNARGLTDQWYCSVTGTPNLKGMVSRTIIRPIFRHSDDNDDGDYDDNDNDDGDYDDNDNDDDRLFQITFF
jgi:hypothetical protein